MSLCSTSRETEFEFFLRTDLRHKQQAQLVTHVTVTIPRFFKRALVLEGAARLHPRDVFDLNLGRIVALEHALLDSGLSKVARTRIWNDYWSMGGGKPAPETRAYQQIANWFNRVFA